MTTPDPVGRPFMSNNLVALIAVAALVIAIIALVLQFTG